MPSKLSKRRFELRLALIKAHEDYCTQLYFETMPKCDPMYSYCYSTSSRNILSQYQSVDAWLRAIIKHMSLRLPGHGGQKTNALVISIYPSPDPDKNIFVDYEIAKIRKRATQRVKSIKIS